MADRPPSPLLEKLVVVRHGGPQQTVVTELRRVILRGDAPPGLPVVVIDPALRPDALNALHPHDHPPTSPPTRRPDG